MPVYDPPDTGQTDLGYSINSGGVYTLFTNFLTATASEQMRKVIERKLKGEDYTRILLGRITYGTIKIKLEDNATIFALVNGWRNNKTEIYLREIFDDSLGSHGTYYIYIGKVAGITPAQVPDEDSAAEFDFTLQVYGFTHTPAA